MRKLGLILVPVALLALIDIGCRGDAAEEGVAPEHTTHILSYKMASGAAELKDAPYDGTYILYRVGSNQVEFSKSLNRGEKIGFKKAETGSVTAVAGDEEKTIPDSNYMWVRK